MSWEVRIYHNPRCSKSHRALKLVRKAGVNSEIVEYLQTPPSASQIRKLLAMLGVTVRDVMRTNEPIYSTRGLDDNRLTEDQLTQAIIEHPILLQRPIVVANGKAVIGRPPETLTGA